ncbi:MAG: hypothetical protein P8Z30_04775, partial [Acidobacteriota bacterium]
LDKIGVLSFKTFVGVLVLIYLASIIGPPPPRVEAVAWAGIFSWFFVAWAYWIDQHRTTEKPSSLDIE